VLRGGSFNNNPDNCRATIRNHRHPTNLNNNNNGFREARSAAQIGQQLAGWLEHARQAQCEPWLSRLLDAHPFERHRSDGSPPERPAEFDHAGEGTLD
jgi:hypothetical protein